MLVVSHMTACTSNFQRYIQYLWQQQNFARKILMLCKSICAVKSIHYDSCSRYMYRMTTIQ